MAICLCILGVTYISILLHLGISVWQELPIKEVTRDHPLYITKELEL